MARAKTLAMLGLCAAMTACTTMRPVDDPTPHKILGRVEVGQTVKVTVRDGRAFTFEVTELQDDVIIGSDGRTRYKIAYKLIEQIEVEETSLLKTAGAAVGGYYIVSAIAVLILVAALGGL